MIDEVMEERSLATSWLDAFPWLRNFAGQDDDREMWWQTPLVGLGAGDRHQRIAQVSDIALDRLGRWTLGQIFTTLPPDIALDALPLPTRARNMSKRLGLSKTGDLMNQELGDILLWPGIGIGTVDSLLQVLAATSLDSGNIHFRDDLFRVVVPSDDEPQLSQGQLSNPALNKDLVQVASWCIAIGMPDYPFLAVDPAPWTPLQVTEAIRRLQGLSAVEVLAGEHLEITAARLLDQCLEHFDDRTLEILRNRFLADSPATLDELGRDLGVTRERVRQIESKARAEMVSYIGPGGALEQVALSTRGLIGQLLPLEELITQMPALKQMVPAVQYPVWRVLDRLDDSYEIADGWCGSPTIQGAKAATQTKLQELANTHGVVRIDDVDGLNSIQESAVGRRSLLRWLEYCGYEMDARHVLLRTQSVGDRAAAALSIAGAPMTSAEILSTFAIERSLGALKNAMGVDDRFKRVDRDTWALSEWGLESYTGVRGLIRDELARNDGLVDLDGLVERLTSKYSVTASSVIAYASAPPFAATGGVVRIASEREPGKSPERTRRLYRRGDEWLYRIRVTKEHLRGSGTPAPAAITRVLGLGYGEVRKLESVLGPQSVSWIALQPTFSTIRRFLIEEDIEIDSEIFLVVRDDGYFHIEKVEQPAPNDLHHALALVGLLHRDRADARQDLAMAIGLPEDSPTSSVIGGFRERGDIDVADLLTSSSAEIGGPISSGYLPATEVTEILDLL